MSIIEKSTGSFCLTLGLLHHSYRLPALWRPPPSDPSISYEPYVSPVTAQLIEDYTLPSMKATLDELVALGQWRIIMYHFCLLRYWCETGRAMGFPDSKDGLPSSYSEDLLASTKALHVDPASTHTPSMLLDAQRDQPIEVEVIFGEVVRLAREFNVAVPVS